MNIQTVSFDSMMSIFRSSFSQLRKYWAHWYLLGAIDLAIPMILTSAIPFIGVFLQIIASSFLCIGLMCLSRDIDVESPMQVKKIFSAFSIHPERVFKGILLQFLFSIGSFFVFVLTLSVVVLIFSGQFSTNLMTLFLENGFTIDSLKNYFGGISTFEIFFFVVFVPVWALIFFSVYYIATFFTTLIIYFENSTFGESIRMCLNAWKTNFWELNIYLIGTFIINFVMLMTIFGICYIPAYNAISFQKLYSLIFVKNVEPVNG